MSAERYGRVKLATIRRKVNDLRDAIRRSADEDVLTAWENVEPYVDRVFVAGEKQ